MGSEMCIRDSAMTSKTSLERIVGASLVFILYGGEVAVKEAGKAEFYLKSSRTLRIYCQKRICTSLILLKRNERLIIDGVKRR